MIDPDSEVDEKAAVEAPVLIAELTGPGRWAQTAFPEWFINNFFEVLPDTNDFLRLFPVTQGHGVGPGTKSTVRIQEEKYELVL